MREFSNSNATYYFFKVHQHAYHDATLISNRRGISSGAASPQYFLFVGVRPSQYFVESRLELIFWAVVGPELVIAQVFQQAVMRSSLAVCVSEEEI